MGEMRAVPGTVAWVDLTVPKADRLRDFYAQVVGWSPDAVDMGGYSDFNMLPAEGEHPAAGICHTRGANADMPAVWMVYISVENLQRSLDRCMELGGELLLNRREDDGSGFCVIRDPAGAIAALYQPPRA